MKFHELKERALVLDTEEQARIKGGTNDTTTDASSSIIGGDLDVF